ncbi:MAG: SusC/RagA family TonB-linked outer membrane protein, partial [Cyclobacteriaceae bacterium]|nr:SusC/RagA family TonB-linked outer membrane protein [Cyclobacteriaceae bacterium HetDA_MAG_MS6]
MKRRLQVFRSPLNVLPLIFLMIIHVGANADAKDSSQNDRKIKYNLENATLEEAFQDIENKTQLRFSFDDQVIDKNVRITFKGKADLEEVLKVISRDAELQFKRINENVHVKKRYVVPKTSGSSTKRVQGSTVSGKVTDESGAGLPGATVKVQGTSTGTITDLDGNFSIVVEPDAVLEVSFIGYVTKTIVVGGRSTVDVGMDLDIQALSEVVVIGYGTRDERDVVGAISSISTDEIAQSMAALTPEMAMQGRMAGVFVSNPGGDPTARPEIRIRGVGSFNNNDPLYVIDGVPVVEFGSIPVAGVDQARAEDIRGSVNIMNMINPADIESISVLKDATAAAIYGSRAANGVILITTKNGQAGKPKVTFSAQYGVKNVTDTYDVLNTPQYTSYLTDAYNNSNQTLPFYLDPSDAGYLGNSQSDDWQDALINDNAVSENYSVNVSGGNDFSTYYIGVAYANEEASLKFNETERYTVTLNSDHQVTPWLKVGQTARLAYMDVLQNRSNGTFEDLTRIPAWQPVYDANGDPARILERVDDGSGGIADSLFYGLVTARNPIGVNETQRFGTEFWRFLGSAYVEVEPIKDLKIRGGVSYDWNLNQRTQFIGFDRRFFRTGGNPSAGSDFSQRDSRTTNLLKDITISYNKAFGDHRLDVVLNASEQSTLASGVSAEYFEIP